LVDVILCGNISVSVDIRRRVFFKIGRRTDRITDSRLLLLLCCMASDNTVDGLKPLYGRIDAVVHDAGSGWHRSRGFGDGHYGRHCSGGPSFEACNDQHNTMVSIDDKAE